MFCLQVEEVGMQGEFGVTLHTGDLSFDEISRFARESEELGYHGFWLTEENGKEAFALLALLARDTSRIQLGTGIVNFYSRSPMTLAMGARTIWGLSGGRFLLGLGTGGVGFMTQGHGVSLDRPVARARETVEIVRRFLTERRFSYDGEWFKVRDFHLREGGVDGHLPIYLAALGPQMVRAAARHYDGFIMNWPTAAAIDEYREIVAREADAAGRDPAEVKILTLLQTVADPDDPTSVDAMRRGLAFYCGSEHYLHIADITGLGAEARKVKEVWETGDYRRAATLVTDDMVAAFSLWGSPAHCAAELRRLLAASVYPIIYPVPRHDRMVEDHFATIRLVAEYAAHLPAPTAA
jgi:5,10-methylenetetrahydromethanopterin reductase